jgi:hypothetical protein
MRCSGARRAPFCRVLVSAVGSYRDEPCFPGTALGEEGIHGGMPQHGADLLGFCGGGSGIHEHRVGMTGNQPGQVDLLRRHRT